MGKRKDTEYEWKWQMRQNSKLVEVKREIDE